MSLYHHQDDPNIIYYDNRPSSSNQGFHHHQHPRERLDPREREYTRNNHNRPHQEQQQYYPPTTDESYSSASESSLSQAQNNSQQLQQQQERYQASQAHYITSSSNYPDHHSRNYQEYNPHPQQRIRMVEIPEKFHDERENSEIFINDSYLKSANRPPPVGSVYSQGRPPSELSSVRTTNQNRNGVLIETMAGPNPCCPNTKGTCCLLVLINLGLILVTLGFSIVLQLYDPPFVWYCGILFLIVGFIALISSLIFLVYLCNENRDRRNVQNPNGNELYWTHHWQKNIQLP